MLICKVVKPLVSTNRIPDFEHKHLQVVLDGSTQKVAVDAVGCVPGDWVICVGSSAAREAAGELMVITLRDKGRLVGYFVGIVAPGLHYSTCLTLTMDIFWTHPDIRGGFAGVKLFRAVEKEAKRRGVQRMFYGSKLHKDCGSLFRYLGLEPIETYYSKWIGA